MRTDCCDVVASDEGSIFEDEVAYGLIVFIVGVHTPEPSTHSKTGCFHRYQAM